MQPIIRGALLPIGLASLLAFALLAPPPAAAQTWTWTGAGPDNNWSTGANWSAGVPPPSGPTTQVIFTGSRFQPVVDLPWTVNRIEFQAGYTLTGQPITLAGAAPGITGNVISFVHNPITLTGPAAFSAQTGLTFSGGIAGTGPLGLIAVGGISLVGMHTYTGGTNVVLGAAGISGSMLGPVTVNNGGTFRGSNGTVNGPVIVNSGGGTGGVLGTGDLLIAGYALMIINGPTQGAQYDRIAVSGSVTLDNAGIDLSGAYVPAAGDVFTIIVNDGTDPVVGSFAGLPEGGVIAFNGVPLRISYTGGTGNDVTLSAGLFGPAQAVPTLSQWALILLAAVVVFTGLLRLRR